MLELEDLRLKLNGTSVIDGFNDMGQYSSLALKHVEDGDDIPHISYYDASLGDLRIAIYVGSSSGNCALNANWHCYIVDGGPENNVGQYSSLALDSDGNPHISYYDANTNDLKYAQRHVVLEPPYQYWTDEKVDEGSENNVGQ